MAAYDGMIYPLESPTDTPPSESEQPVTALAGASDTPSPTASTTSKDYVLELELNDTYTISDDRNKLWSGIQKGWSQDQPFFVFYSPRFFRHYLTQYNHNYYVKQTGHSI